MCSRIASRRVPMLASLAERPRATLTPCIFTPIGRLTRCHTAHLTYEQPGQWSYCARRVLPASVSVNALTPSTDARLHGMTYYVLRSTTWRYSRCYTHSVERAYMLCGDEGHMGLAFTYHLMTFICVSAKSVQNCRDGIDGRWFHMHQHITSTNRCSCVRLSVGTPKRCAYCCRHGLVILEYISNVLQQ
ncbi:hypothetical protein TPPCIT_160 [Candidatus Tremblaya princeps PCIT]|uniref:SWIM-type domain-containing protein n=1 Tax=Tremblaya princeps (strain PCIT) TaxID=891398 RepID=F7XYM3_TREPP|nr:hypothetical protein TPPCIT_160 [Candidatus Tremblaya princeps PCIT]